MVPEPLLDVPLGFKGEQHAVYISQVNLSPLFYKMCTFVWDLLIFSSFSDVVTILLMVIIFVYVMRCVCSFMCHVDNHTFKNLTVITHAGRVMISMEGTIFRLKLTPNVLM
jgi:hypothetical protein